MKSLLLPIMACALFALPAAADAAQCRNSDSGKFAKCGAPGSVPASQYVAKTKSMKAKSKMMAPAMAAPSATMPAKPGFMASMKARMKPAAMATPAAKAMRCKNAKSKFVKCGTAGAKPA